ncbi:MAG: 4-phosphoerythronate dehydrogenase [Gammaproteobacteria bacterium]|nr:4-phosphoerythronate dehydrogenase [Gammaproteobacteria bacterium]
MKIVADAGLYKVQELFAEFGELELLSGRDIDAAAIKDTDALLIRSVTSVTTELLKDSSIKFVGTATSGTDHIDVESLHGRGIVLADARGSNANAVVDYCFAGIGYGVIHRGIDIKQSRVGIVGHGCVGSLLAQKLNAMGVETCLCDPPLQEVAGPQSTDKYSTLDVIAQCQIVSLHVPLSKNTSHQTLDLIDAEFLRSLRAGTLLINTCRGSVVNEIALLQVLGERPDLCCVVDVWENEPAPSSDLVMAVDLATPHIAGYSLEAKRSATRQLLDQFCQHFGVTVAHTADTAESKPVAFLAAECRSANVWEAILEMLPLERISEEFKTSVAAGNSQQAFDELRKKLVARRELRSYQMSGIKWKGGQRLVGNALGIESV